MKHLIFVILSVMLAVPVSAQSDPWKKEARNVVLKSSAMDSLKKQNVDPSKTDARFLALIDSIILGKRGAFNQTLTGKFSLLIENQQTHAFTPKDTTATFLVATADLYKAKAWPGLPKPKGSEYQVPVFIADGKSTVKFAIVTKFVTVVATPAVVPPPVVKADTTKKKPFKVADLSHMDHLTENGDVLSHYNPGTGTLDVVAFKDHKGRISIIQDGRIYHRNFLGNWVYSGYSANPYWATTAFGFSAGISFGYNSWGYQPNYFAYGGCTGCGGRSSGATYWDGCRLVPIDFGSGSSSYYTGNSGNGWSGNQGGGNVFAGGPNYSHGLPVWKSQEVANTASAQVTTKNVEVQTPMETPIDLRENFVGREPVANVGADVTVITDPVTEDLREQFTSRAPIESSVVPNAPSQEEVVETNLSGLSGRAREAAAAASRELQFQALSLQEQVQRTAEVERFNAGSGNSTNTASGNGGYGATSTIRPQPEVVVDRGFTTGRQPAPWLPASMANGSTEPFRTPDTARPSSTTGSVYVTAPEMRQPSREGNGGNSRPAATPVMSRESGGAPTINRSPVAVKR